MFRRESDRYYNVKYFPFRMSLTNHRFMNSSYFVEPDMNTASVEFSFLPPTLSTTQYHH